MRALFDTNVVLDVVLQRDLFAESAAALFDAVDAGRVDGMFTPATFTTTAYFVERNRSEAESRHTRSCVSFSSQRAPKSDVSDDLSQPRNP